MYEGNGGHALEIDAKAPLLTNTASEVREFEVREWSVCRILSPGPVWLPGAVRVVVTCEVVDALEGEWREFHVEYSPRFIREHRLQREESLILHARCQIAAELNSVFGLRDRSQGQWPIVISMG
jgi:hypothetical protein